MASNLLFFAAYFSTSEFPFKNIKLDKAIFFHLFMQVFVIIGYILRSLFEIKSSLHYVTKGELKFKSSFYFVSIALMIFGLSSVLFQISATQSVGDYLSMLFSDSKDLSIRDAYLTSSEDGGVSGIYKVFAQAPLSIYLFTFSLLNLNKYSINERSKRRLYQLNLVALFFTFVKIFFALDRLTILALLLCHVFNIVNSKRIFKLKTFVLAAFFIGFASYITTSRVSTINILDGLLLYFRLGLTNLAILIETQDAVALGRFTLFGPFQFILKFFGINLSPFIFDFDFDPAQYLAGYAFLDFGYGALLFYFSLGFLLAHIDNYALIKKNIYFTSIYFTVLYCTVSFITVPASGGMEFWLCLLIPLILLKTSVHIIKHESHSR